MKKISLLLVLVLLVTAFVGCGGSPSAEEPEANDSESKTTIVMATEATFRPYEYLEGDEVVGVDVEIAKAIAEELGLELYIDSMNFDGIIPAVQSGKADFGAAGMSVTEDRKKQVDFSVEYAESSQVILTHVDSDIEAVEDLNGKVIGVQMSTTADLEYNTDDYPEIEVDSFKKYSEAAMELSNKRIDAIVLDSIPAEALVGQHPDEFRICDEVLFTDTYAIAVQKGNTELLETINKILTQMMEDGKIEEYTQQHLVD